MLPSASHSEARRWLLSLHSVDFVDGRNIPKAALNHFTVDVPFAPADDVGC
jgi:hypothetical protein